VEGERGEEQRARHHAPDRGPATDAGGGRRAGVALPIPAALDRLDEIARVRRSGLELGRSGGADRVRRVGETGRRESIESSTESDTLISHRRGRTVITKLWVKNFGPFENATIDLGPFTVILGTNGAGKSLLFWAMKAIGRVARFPIRPPRQQPIGKSGYSIRNAFVSLDDLVHRKTPSRNVTLGVEFQDDEQKGSYEVTLSRGRFPAGIIVEEHLHWTRGGRTITVDGPKGNVPGIDFKTPRLMSAPFLLANDKQEHELGRSIQAALWDRSAVYRLDPSALKTPASMDGKFSTTGYGFPWLLDQIQNQPDGPASFENLLAAVREMCPHVHAVRLPLVHVTVDANAPSVPKKQIELIMKNSPENTIPVELESDGTVLTLAYAALVHGRHAFRTVCIEEPENGIHPSAMGQQVKMLRKLTQESGDRPAAQVLVTTHSRRFFDEVHNTEEIRLVRRGGDGRSSIEAPSLADRPRLAAWAGLA